MNLARALNLTRARPVDLVDLPRDNPAGKARAALETATIVAALTMLGDGVGIPRTPPTARRLSGRTPSQ